MKCSPVTAAVRPHLPPLCPPFPPWTPPPSKRVLSNRRQGLHTLCLLDIKVKEPNLEALARGRTVYEPPRWVLGCAPVSLALSHWLLRTRTKGFHSGRTHSQASQISRTSPHQPLLSCPPPSLPPFPLPSLPPPPSSRYMSINSALQQLLEVEATRNGGAYGPETTAVGMSRLGSPDQQIVAGSMQQLLDVDFGPPLHCLVIAGGWCAAAAL